MSHVSTIPPTVFIPWTRVKINLSGQFTGEVNFLGTFQFNNLPTEIAFEVKNEKS